MKLWQDSPYLVSFLKCGQRFILALGYLPFNFEGTLYIMVESNNRALFRAISFFIDKLFEKKLNMTSHDCIWF